MPLDAEHRWDRDATLGASEILSALRTHFELRQTPPRADPPPRGCGWSTAGLPPVGIIASVSEAFCSACDRTRLTAAARPKCAVACSPPRRLNLRALLRSGADDREIETAWRTAMWNKAAGHGINDDFVQPRRPMSAIGG